MKNIVLIIVLIFLFGCSQHIKNQPFKGTIYNFGKVDDHIYRGTQPFDGDYQKLKNLGIISVLDLRDDQEKLAPSLAKSAGLKYFHLSMSSTRAPKISDIKSAILIITDSQNWPVYVHCEGGRHRTGVIIAVYRVLIYNWDKQRAWKEAKDYGYFTELGHTSIQDWFLNYFNPKDFQ